MKKGVIVAIIIILAVVIYLTIAGFQNNLMLGPKKIINQGSDELLTLQNIPANKVIPHRTLDGRGDLNCDSLVSFGDINPFVLALSNPTAYGNTFPGCDIMNGDINCNGQFSFDDISSFITCLTQGACPDYEACAFCGDGVVDPGEDCDDDDLNGQTCQTLGYDSGDLTCNEDCTFNTGECQGESADECGNGIVEPGEICDIGLDDGPGGMDDVLNPYNNDCFSFPGNIGGELKCLPDCSGLDMGACIPGETPILSEINQNENVLVVYNVNDLDASDIANYYADMRGISSTRLCGVELPPGQFATAAQMLGARNTIVENCICNAIHETVPSSMWPTPCTINNLNAIAAVSPITHLALIKGIPIRLTETGWSMDYEEPSLQYYLALSIYYDGNIFNDFANGLLPPNYYRYAGGYPTIYNQTSQGWRGYVRRIIPDVDKMVAYGTIEAIDKDRTFNLIYRTLKAEKQGIKGNLLFTTKATGTGYYLYELDRDFSESHNPECFSHYRETDIVWPYEGCRVGGTQGLVPGTESSQVPRAINAFYLTVHNTLAGQRGFHDFNTMLNYHKSEYDCITLCRDMGGEEAVSECRRKSTDYFKEINTECVGVADGFFAAGPCCSWAVQYYGFWPTGWEQSSGGNGMLEKAAPRVLNGDALVNSKFNDNKYLHFGSNSVENPMCTLEDGSIESCEELIPVNLLHKETFNLPLVAEGTKDITLSFWHRNPAMPEGRLKTYLAVYWNDPANSVTYTNSAFFPLDGESSEWNQEATTFSFPALEGYGIKTIVLYFWSDFDYPTKHWLDLDAFELIDRSTMQELFLDYDAATFNKPFIGQTSPGDWAANVIDRMSGIAAWGSSSHFLTGGDTVDSQVFASAFFSGRTFGESFAYAANREYSTIVYADPLYNPSGVKMYIGNGFNKTNYLYDLHSIYFPAVVPYNISTANNNKNWYLKINAFHGRDNYDRTNWNISICRDNSSECFEGTKNWTTIYSGDHAVFEYETPIKLMDLASDPSSDESFFVRLRVWNTGEEENSITSYSYFRYIP